MTRGTAPRNWCILLFVAFNCSHLSTAVPLEALPPSAGEENEVFGRLPSASQHNDAGNNPLERLSEQKPTARKSLGEIMRLLKAKIDENKRNGEKINGNEIGVDQVNAEGSATDSDTEMVQGADASLETEGSGDAPLHGFPPGINEVVYIQHHETPDNSSIQPHLEDKSKADEPGEGLFSDVWHKTSHGRNRGRKHKNRGFSGGQKHGKNKNDSDHKRIVDDKESLKLPLDPGEKPWIYNDDYNEDYSDDYSEDNFNDWSDYYDYYYDDDTDTDNEQVSNHAEGEDESGESSNDDHKSKRNSSTPSPSSSATTTQAGVSPAGTTQQDVNPGIDGKESVGASTTETGTTDFTSATTEQTPTTALNESHNTNITVTNESTSSEPEGNKENTTDSTTTPSGIESSKPKGNEITTVVDSTTLPSETESSEPEGSEITTTVDSTTMSSETESSKPAGNEVTTVDSTTIPTETENAQTKEAFTTEEGDASEVDMTTLATTAQSELPSNEGGMPGNKNYPTTLVELNEIQPPLRDYIIDKLSDQFLGMAEKLHKPNVSNPYPDIKDVVIKALSSFRVDVLSTVTKRSIPDGTGSARTEQEFWVNGIKFHLNVPRYPDFIQAGDTEVKNIVINRKRMYVYLELRFNNVTVPVDFKVKADLFPPFFSIPNTEGSAEISMDYILIPLRIPYQLLFQKRKNLDGKDTALGILVPDDFVSHGVSMVGVSTKILGCKDKDFMAKRVLRFEEHLKNALELWLSGEPLATLANSLRQQLLKKARETASLSLQRAITD